MRSNDRPSTAITSVRLRRQPLPFLARGMALVVATAVLGTATACRGESREERETDTPARATTSAAPAGTVAGATSSVPPTVEAVGHHAENAYDMAKVGDWAKARASADSLREAVDALPASMGAPGASRDEVMSAFVGLDAAISRRERVAALRASNRLTELGARLAAPFQPQVPSDVTLLDYYGRELEIWAAAGDRPKLRETTAAMRSTWDALRVRLEARGGSAEATRFEALVARVEAASRPAEYARLATPVLDAVDTLEQVFNR